jgi:uncharacterized membrane protein
MHHVIELVLPYIITVLEIMGIFVVVWTSLHSFFEYLQNSFMRKRNDIQLHLSKGLATGLEFKLAAEILKTVLVQSMDELYILGAVILLRALMSALIHFEMRGMSHHQVHGNDKETKSVQSSDTTPENTDPGK